MNEELIEKVARFISEFKDWDGARQYVKDGWLYKADQLISLISAEARKQEYQRFITAMESEVEYHGKDSAVGIAFLQVLTHIFMHKDFLGKHGQALEEGGKEAE